MAAEQNRGPEILGPHILFLFLFLVLVILVVLVVLFLVFAAPPCWAESGSDTGGEASLGEHHECVASKETFSDAAPCQVHLQPTAAGTKDRTSPHAALFRAAVIHAVCPFCVVLVCSLYLLLVNIY